MKRLFFILTLFLSIGTSAQITQYIGAPNTTLENKGYQKINKTPEDSGANIIPMVIDTVTHKVGTRKLGINVDGPYLEGTPGSTVYDRDHIRFNPDSAQRWSNAATIVEDLNLDYPTWEGILNVDSVHVTGLVSKTITTFYHNGTSFSAPFIDLTGGGFGRLYYNGYGILKPNDSTFAADPAAIFAAFAGTSPRIPFYGTGGHLSSSDFLSVDSANRRLNIGSPTTPYSLNVQKNINGFDGIAATNSSTGTNAVASIEVRNDAGRGGGMAAGSTTNTNQGIRNRLAISSYDGITIAANANADNAPYQQDISFYTNGGVFGNTPSGSIKPNRHWIIGDSTDTYKTSNPNIQLTVRHSAAILDTLFVGACVGCGTGSGGSSAWSSITGKPTTISGYGITDAQTALTFPKTVVNSGGAVALENETTTWGPNKIYGTDAAGVKGVQSAAVIDASGAVNGMVPIYHDGSYILGTPASATFKEYTFIGTNGQTTYTNAVLASTHVRVWREGELQRTTAATLSGSTVTFTPALASGEAVYIESTPASYWTVSALLGHNSQFTATNGTTLTSYVPDFGNAWDASTNYTIQSGRLINSSSQVVTTDVGLLDYTITSLYSLVTNSDDMRFVLRSKNSNADMVVVKVNSGGISFFNYVGGVSNNWQNTTVLNAAGTDHFISITLSGQAISLAIDGGTTVTATIPTTQDGTRAGLWFIPSAPGAITMNYFTVQ